MRVGWRASDGRAGRIARRTTFLALLAGLFLLPYAQVRGWSFPASTAGLLVLFAVTWRRDAPRRAGLAIRPVEGVAVLALALALGALFGFALVPALAASAGLRLEAGSIGEVAVFPFQALNEEIALGYLLLAAIVGRFGRPALVAVAVAVLFAGLHVLLYRYGSLHTPVAAGTVVALLAIGVVRNSAILLGGHVGYAWALHAAWNVAMFGGRWRHADDGTALLEPEVLDAFLGPPLVAGAASVAAVLLIAVLVRRGTRAGGSGPAAVETATSTRTEREPGPGRSG